MAPRIITVGIALVALAGCSREPDPPVEQRPAGDSPDAVANAWIVAMDEGDFKRVVGCLAPDWVRERAADEAWSALELRDGLERRYGKDVAKRPAGEEIERRQRADRLDPVLLEHGLTQQVSDDLKRLPTEEAARKALAKKIRNPAGFLVRYLEVTRDSQPNWRKGNGTKPRVEDVVIDGGNAKGQLISTSNRVDKGDKQVEFKKDITFIRLRDGNWRIV